MPLFTTPYQKQTPFNQVGQPLILSVAIAGMSLVLLGGLFAEVLLLGKWAGPVLLVLMLLIGVEWGARNGALMLRLRPFVFYSNGRLRGWWALFTLAGLLFTVLWVLDFGGVIDWPLEWWHVNDTYRHWYVNEVWQGDVRHWTWVILVLAIPVCLPAPVLVVIHRFQAEIAYPNLRDSVRAKPARINRTGTGPEYDDGGVDDEPVNVRTDSRPLDGEPMGRIFAD